jgi:hypothetical protein
VLVIVLVLVLLALYRKYFLVVLQAYNHGWMTYQLVLVLVLLLLLLLLGSTSTTTIGSKYYVIPETAETPES